MNIFRTRTRRGAAILFSGVLVLGGLALADEATAQQDAKNPSCADLGYTYGQRWEVPSDPYAIDRDGMIANFTVGTYGAVVEEPNENNAITAATIITKADGYAVIVKGGENGYNLYPKTQAVPMHPPANDNGKWATISHFDLCWNKPAPEPAVGSLQVTKALAGETVPATEPPTQYEICIKGVTPATEQQCKMVTGAGMVTFGDLKPGTYEVTETSPGSGYTVKIAPTEPVVVTAGDVPATAIVTNTYKAPSTPPPPEEEVVPPTQEALPPSAPVAPTAPAAPVTPPAPAAPAEVSAQVPAQTALPTTGSEGGLAAIAAILVTTGVGLTLLTKRRGTQQA